MLHEGGRFNSVNELLCCVARWHAELLYVNITWQNILLKPIFKLLKFRDIKWIVEIRKTIEIAEMLKVQIDSFLQWTFFLFSLQSSCL